MTRRSKIFVWILIGLCVLVAGLLLAAKFLMTPERIRQSLVPVLEDVLEREVQVGAIDIGLFSGILVEKFEIRDPVSRQTLLAAQKAVLKYQFWPLLSRQVVIDQVLLVAPELTLIRTQGGGFNTFTTHQPSAAQQPDLQESSAVGPTSSKVDLFLTEINIQDGKVVFIDQELNPIAPFRYQIEHLNLHAKDVSLDKGFPIDFSGELDNAPFRVEGQINPKEPNSNVKISIDGLDLAHFSPYFKSSLPGLFSRARLSLALDVAATSKQLALNGGVTLAGMHLVLDSMKDSPIRNGELALNLDLLADHDSARLVIHPSTVRYNRIPLQLQGKILHLNNKVELDLSVVVDKLNVRDAIASLPEELTRQTNSLDPAGTISLQGHLKGDKLESPLMLLTNASVTLDELQANLGGFRPSLSGPVVLQNKVLTADNLQISIGDNHAEMNMKIADIQSSPMPVTAALSAETFNLDPFLPTSEKTESSTSEPVEEAASTKPSEELGPYNLPVAADGTVKIKQLNYRGLVSDNLDLHFELKKNLLTIDRLTGNLAGGHFNQTAEVDFSKKGLGYQTDLRLDQAQATPLVGAFAPKLKGVVQGQLQFAASASGRGTQWGTLKQQLLANGTANMSQLQLTNAPIVADLADFLQLTELKKVLFDQSEATFKIVRGSVEVDSAFSNPQFSFRPKGVVGLGGELNLSLPTALNPKVAARLGGVGKASNLLVNTKGWTELPIKVKGTVSAPKFKLDTKQIRKKAIKKLEEKLLQKLGPKQSEGTPVDPGKQLLQDALKGLFGD